MIINILSNHEFSKTRFIFGVIKARKSWKRSFRFGHYATYTPHINNWYELVFYFTEIGKLSSTFEKKKFYVIILAI